MGTPFKPGSLKDPAGLKEQIEAAQAAWEKRFAEASEEEQMLMLHAQKISMMYGLSDFDSKRTKEDVARKVLEHTFGPKFTARALLDEKCRALLGLENEKSPSTRPSSLKYLPEGR